MRATQMALDGRHRLIAATEPTPNAGDRDASVELPDKVGDRLNVPPGTVSADAGYCDGRDLSERGWAPTGTDCGDRWEADGDAKTHPATHRMVRKPVRR